MEICKKCGRLVNMTIFGMPDDICWGCADKETKDEAINLNIGLVKERTKQEKEE